MKCSVCGRPTHLMCGKCKVIICFRCSDEGKHGHKGTWLRPVSKDEES